MGDCRLSSCSKASMSIFRSPVTSIQSVSNDEDNGEGSGLALKKKSELCLYNLYICWS